MKVSIITPTLGLGGAEMWIRNLAMHCRGIRWKVGVLSNDPYHPLIGNAVSQYASLHSTHRLTGETAVHADQHSMVKAVCAGADAVVVWGGGDYWPLPTREPVVFVAHGSCVWTRKAAEQARDGGAEQFVGVSEASTRLLETCGLKATTIWNGVDTERLRPRVPCGEMRSRLKTNEYDYVKLVAYVGRLGNEKNLDGVINAVASLPYHYELVLVGCTGWSKDRILQFARAQLPGRLREVEARDDIGTVLSACDCLVQISPREGNSLTVCESMLCSVPVVSTRTGAIPEMESMAGRPLVRSVPEDPTSHEVAEAIREVCFRFPFERVRAAEEFATKHLTADVMCRKWENYLRSL